MQQLWCSSGSGIVLWLRVLGFEGLGTLNPKFSEGLGSSALSSKSSAHLDGHPWDM